MNGDRRWHGEPETFIAGLSAFHCVASVSL